MWTSNSGTLRVFLLVTLVSFVTLSCSKREENEQKPAEFEVLSSPAGPNASLPHLIAGDDDFLYLSWVEKRDSGWVDFKYSRMENKEWSAPELIASGNDWFVNWADYPMIAVDMDGNMMGHFLAKSSEGTYSYDVNVVYKKSAGDWSEPVIPHKDGTPTEHGFATILPRNDGSFLLAWLDGRNTGGGHDSHDGHGAGAMTIRSAVMNLDGNISEEAELDNRVCDCCQTTGVMLDSGPVFMYRDRSDLEIRDMYMVKKTTDDWSLPAPIHMDNWNIKGCPVNGPRAAGAGNTMAVGWFTAANSKPEVKITFSSDGGESLDTPILIDGTDPMGRVDVAMLDAKMAAISWLDTKNDSTYIKFKTVTSSGTTGNEMIVSSTDASRSSGFPQMEAKDQALYFAWTSLSEDGSEIKFKKLDLRNKSTE